MYYSLKIVCPGKITKTGKLSDTWLGFTPSTLSDGRGTSGEGVMMYLYIKLWHKTLLWGIKFKQHPTTQGSIPANVWRLPAQQDYPKKVSDSFPYTKKARTTQVMLTRASTTSLACTQSPKPLSDAQVHSKHDGQLPKRGLQMPRMDTTRALPRDKYSATYPDVKMLWTPARSVINDCACRTIIFKTAPRVTTLRSAAHVTHTGSPWHSLKTPISTDNQSMQCHS